jgi:hypothetical protein
MSETEKTLDEQIRERIKEATQKQIFWKSWRIAKELGKKNEETIEGKKCLTHTFNASSSLVIKHVEDMFPRVVITDNGKEVFNGVEGRTNDNSGHYVNGYIPGKWEAAIEKHFPAAKLREDERADARNREYLKKEAAKEKVKRSKWGLEEASNDVAEAYQPGLKNAASSVEETVAERQQRLKKIAPKVKLA